MKPVEISVGSVLTFWVLGSMVLLLATMFTGGLHTWFWWGWLGLTLGSVALVAGPWLMSSSGHRGRMNALLLRVAVAGWAIFGGGLLALDVSTSQQITWSLPAILGLATWPGFATVMYWTRKG